MKKIHLKFLAIALAAIASSCSTDDITIVEVVGGDSSDIRISGDVVEDMTLTSDNDYLLNDALFVKDGATLTIEAGTTIRARSGGTSVYILVEKGGKINANGKNRSSLISAIPSSSLLAILVSYSTS